MSNPLSGYSPPQRRGSALLIVIVFVSLIAGLGTALVGFDLQTGRSRRGVASEQRAFYASEAAINEAYAAMLGGALDPALGETLTLGEVGAPRTLGTSTHWAQVTRLDARRYSVVGTGRDAGSLVRHEAILSHAPNGLFQYAAFGRDGVRLDSNAFIDSYDSMLGGYAAQVAAGTDYAREAAVVGSNADVRLMSNTVIHGDCHPGPGGALYATAPGILVTGSTDPATQPVDLPAIPPPAALSLGDSNLTADITLGPGIVRYDDLSVGGGATLTIQGPAQLVVDNFRMSSGTVLVLDASSGPIELHSAHDFDLESNTTVVTQSDSAVDVKLFLSGDNRVSDPTLRADISLASNAAFIGAIYAPNAEVQLGSNFEIYGSVMAGLLDLSSNGRIHFDEALLYDGTGVEREFVTMLWRPLGRSED